MSDLDVFDLIIDALFHDLYVDHPVGSIFVSEETSADPLLAGRDDIVTYVKADADTP